MSLSEEEKRVVKLYFDFCEYFSHGIIQYHVYLHVSSDIKMDKEIISGKNTDKYHIYNLNADKYPLVVKYFESFLEAKVNDNGIMQDMPFLTKKRYGDYITNILQNIENIASYGYFCVDSGYTIKESTQKKDREFVDKDLFICGSQQKTFIVIRFSMLSTIKSILNENKLCDKDLIVAWREYVRKHPSQTKYGLIPDNYCNNYLRYKDLLSLAMRVPIGYLFLTTNTTNLISLASRNNIGKSPLKVETNDRNLSNWVNDEIKSLISGMTDVKSSSNTLSLTAQPSPTQSSPQIFDKQNNKIIWSCSHVNENTKSPFCPTCGSKVIGRSCEHINEQNKEKFCSQCGKEVRMVSFDGTKESKAVESTHVKNKPCANDEAKTSLNRKVVLQQLCSLLPQAKPQKLVQFLTERQGGKKFLNLNTLRLNNEDRVSTKGMLINKEQKICMSEASGQHFDKIVYLFEQLSQCPEEKDEDLSLTGFIDFVLNLPEPDKRKSVSKRIRKEIFEESGGDCSCCDKPITEEYFELGHIIPHKFGGKSEKDNLTAICQTCNDEMGTMYLYEYMMIADFPYDDEDEDMVQLMNTIRRIHNQSTLIIKMIKANMLKGELKVSQEYLNKIVMILSDKKKYYLYHRDTINSLAMDLF